MSKENCSMEIYTEKEVDIMNTKCDESCRSDSDLMNE